MREQEWLDEGYPCQGDAAEHEVHPCFDRLSWQDGFRRGYEEGRLDGEHLATKAVRGDVLYDLQQVACDLRLGLLDLHTPLAMLHWVAGLIEDQA